MRVDDSSGALNAHKLVAHRAVLGETPGRGPNGDDKYSRLNTSSAPAAEASSTRDQGASRLVAQHPETGLPEDGDSEDAQRVLARRAVDGPAKISRADSADAVLAAQALNRKSVAEADSQASDDAERVLARRAMEGRPTQISRADSADAAHASQISKPMAEAASKLGPS